MKFIRSNFFPLKKTFDLNEFKKFHKDHILFSSYSNNFEIKEISSLSYFRDNSFLFLETETDISNIKHMNIHIVSNIENNKNYYKNISIVKNLNLSYNIICNKLFYHDDHIDYKDDLILMKKIVKYLKKKNLFGDAVHITNFIKKNKKLTDISEKNKIKVIKYRKDLY